MLGPQVKGFRKKKKWSQEQLAQEAGLKQVIVSRIERGIRKVDTDELQKIARALGVPIVALLDNEALSTAVGE